MQCDICSSSGEGSIVPARKFSTAVKNGFNPFHNGCIPEAMARLAAPGYPERWAQSAMHGETSSSDWYVCRSCMRKLSSYLEPVEPTIKQVKSPVPTSEPKIIREKQEILPTIINTKRWWQFWK